MSVLSCDLGGGHGRSAPFLVRQFGRTSASRRTRCRRLRQDPGTCGWCAKSVPRDPDSDTQYLIPTMIRAAPFTPQIPARWNRHLGLDVQWPHRPDRRPRVLESPNREGIMRVLVSRTGESQPLVKNTLRGRLYTIDLAVDGEAVSARPGVQRGRARLSHPDPKRAETVLDRYSSAEGKE
jgi:hypothetical protein